MLDRLWLAGDDGRYELDQEIGVVVARDKESTEDGLDLNAQLLTKFAPCGIQVGLSGLDLSAGEFPEAAMSFVDGPPTDQIPTTLADHGRQHSFHSGRLRSVVREKCIPDWPRVRVKS